MRKKNQRITLSAESVRLLEHILENASRKKRLNVLEKQIAEDFLENIRKQASPTAHNLRIPKGLALSVLKLLISLLADNLKLKILFDLFRGGSK